MNERLEEFLGLSVALTAFGRLRLLGTGMAEKYLQVLDAILPGDVLSTMLSTYASAPTGEARQAAISSQIIADPKLGPVAKNVIVLWYCGTWKQLPHQWADAYGRSPLDETHVISSAAYLSGLQWHVVGAHPGGGLQQGFGAWAVPPEGGER
jgi:hypothetical protein